MQESCGLQLVEREGALLWARGTVEMAALPPRLALVHLCEE